MSSQAATRDWDAGKEVKMERRERAGFGADPLWLFYTAEEVAMTDQIIYLFSSGNICY